ncbi:MAG: caspase family protein [Planctomycetia bacterium]|nr:caspase family protein [Planctomycetia bacterium]
MTLSRLIYTVTFFLILLSGNSLYAQKIYFLASGDVRDEKVGQFVQDGLEFVNDVMSEVVPSDRLVVYNKSSNWSGSNIERSRNVRHDLLKAIENCPVGSNDTIFIYWCGHGGYDQGGHFLWIRNPSNLDALTPMRRADVVNALEKKNARLKVFVTESCNVYQSFEVDKTGFGPEADDAVPPIVRSLLLEPRGLVNINSCSPNQTAKACETFGGPFTYFLFGALYDQCNRSMSWQEIVKVVDQQAAQKKLQQRVYAWSLPGGASESPVRRDDVWSDPIFHPERGDRVIEVAVLDSGTYEVNSVSEFDNIIANAPNPSIILTIVDQHTGNRYYMRTTLGSSGFSSSRLGLQTSNTSEQGVRVDGYAKGSPAAKCQYLKNGDVQEVRR